MLSDQLIEKKLPVFVDHFEKIMYQKDEKLNHTLWFCLVGPGATGVNSANLENSRGFMRFLASKATGLVKPPLRVRVGKTIANKGGRAQNFYMFAEFESEASIVNIISLMSKRRVPGLGTFRCYKAGTNTYVQIRRSKRR
jgi:hypothetical protein